MFGFGDSSDDDDVSYRKDQLAEQKVDENVFAESEDGADRAGHAPRRCTDCVCLIIFVSTCVFFFGFIYHYCTEHGDFRRLYHGYDYRGRLCGVDLDDENNTLGDYLFWCRKKNDLLGLDLAHPICTDQCPSMDNETRNCAQFPPIFGDQIATDAHGSFTQQITYIFDSIPQYASKAWAGRYCMPEDNALITQVMEFINNQGFASKMLFRVGETLSAWPALLIAGLFAVILGFVFLVVILECAQCLVWLCLLVLIVLPICGGGYFVYIGFSGGTDQYRGTGDGQWDLIIGFSCIVIGLIFGCLACCARRAIQTAIAVLQATCYCMFSMPSLLFEPFINVLTKMFVMVMLLLGFAWLLSCGEIQKASILEVGVASVPGSDLGGVFRSFHYKEDEIYYILIYCFMIFWIMEIFTALGQFTICYAVQLWYFTPYPQDEDYKEDVPNCGICKGMCVGLTFHLGSLSFGAFIIAVFRIIRLLTRLFISQTKEANAAVACIGKMLECCLGCCQKCVEFLNKNAYMDIAITSSNFCTAARRAMTMILKYLGEIAILNGATAVIGVLGMGAISAGAAYLTWLVLGNWSYFSEPSSDHFVEAKEAVTVLAALISLLIAWSFMSVFDTVADTILYCYAIEMKRKTCQPPMYPKNMRFAPHELDDLVSSGVGERY